MNECERRLVDKVADQFARAYPKTTAAMQCGTWTPVEEASLAELFGGMDVELKEDLIECGLIIVERDEVGEERVRFPEHGRRVIEAQKGRRLSIRR